MKEVCGMIRGILETVNDEGQNCWCLCGLWCLFRTSDQTQISALSCYNG